MNFHPVLSADGMTWDIDATIAAGAARPLIDDDGAFVCEECGRQTASVFQLPFQQAEFEGLPDKYVCDHCLVFEYHLRYDARTRQFSKEGNPWTH